MPLNVLFIGGSGEISAACVQEAIACGHQVTVFNRGMRSDGLTGVNHVAGDLRQPNAYAALGSEHFDVVCQFLGFQVADVERDIDFFAGRCGHYIFISSASCYEKPWHTGRITETVPLHNPFMAYSRNKAACEQRLHQAHTNGQLPVTIVRPSHTYCERLPSTVIDGTHLLWRLRAGKPVLLHDGGATQWTLTRSEDFARGFVQLFGLPRALGEAYHITDNVAHSWQHIFASIAQLAGTDLQTCSVPSTTLVEHIELLRGPLLGDKANSLLFDNTKIAEATGGWRCEIALNDGLAKALTHTQQQLDAGYAPPQPLDGQIDQIIAAHTSGATQ